MKASQKSIRCNYSHTPHLSISKKDEDSSFHPKKKRKTRVNVNKRIQCPFCINCALVDHKAPYKDNIFYKVRISSIKSLEHTCLMSESFYRNTLSTKKRTCES